MIYALQKENLLGTVNCYMAKPLFMAIVQNNYFSKKNN